ncbi:MAG: DUF4339 domain-containing protein [Kiritimatiellae bacterium]|nr:DUF4339 domain-containing protein [Kiritimatiellia bacterium]
MQWFYTKNGTQEGPVEYSDIKRLIADGTLLPTDNLWNKSMGEEWKKLSDISEFSDNPQIPALPNTIANPASVGIPGALSTGPKPAHLDGPISCTAPVRASWERMKDILFRPFSMKKWFILGVSAWLATLGEGGGSSSSSGNFGDSQNVSGEDFSQGIAYIKNVWCTYSTYIIIAAAVITLIIIAISLLVAWLKARGKFMLLDNIIKNSEEITEPWHTFKQHGHSLFLWYIAFSIINMLIFLVIGGIGFLSIGMPCIKAQAFAPATVPAIAAVSIITLLYIVITAYIGRFVEDFIIPIMYNRDMTFTEAFGKFRGIYKRNSGKFILYGIFYVVLGMASGIAVLGFIMLTCCTAMCLMMIPFIGTVVMLPVTVFFRVYSVEYLAQFGGDYICFPDEK